MMASRGSLVIRETGDTRLPGGTATRSRGLVFPLTFLGLVVLFLLAPWPFEHKAHAALHGLCSQRPSHSLRLGQHTLPFDARMTGIYGGFLASTVYLAARGRFRAVRLPPRRVLMAAGFFVAAMAVDGTNSLLLDLGLWHPYPPDNRFRLLTGLLAGAALAVILTFVLASTIWRDGRSDQAAVNGLGELGLMTALQTPFALAALSGMSSLYLPVAFSLLLAAVIVIAALVLVVVVLLRYQECSFLSVEQLQGPATFALLLGVGIMGVLAAGRFLLEGVLGAPPLT